MVLFRKLFFKEIGLEISPKCIKRTSMSQVSWETVPLSRSCKAEGSFTEMFQVDLRKFSDEERRFLEGDLAVSVFILN